ncbi:unnamed protein product [Didymodactylos carnosus]|uniref:Microbial-type PARG catalytic domain-containing protein n=1 Tax=Didymodactylos carnosus TaxID=1234261 RepID=A0A815A123_9BILA|nr:unnamed protein product [Didymodactylos carnosus]CAF4020255.1 unnamed protein product [Didymodactylos carnosus]
MYPLSSPPLKVKLNEETVKVDPNDAPLNVEQLHMVKDCYMSAAEKYRHSPTEFVKYFYDQANISSVIRTNLRKLVQIQTIYAVLNGRYRLENGTCITLDKDRMHHSAQTTVQYQSNHQYIFDKNLNYETELFMVQGDCIDAALWFKLNQQCDPVVLNFANEVHPGGGWKEGSAAQEENLHRRTNLFECLEDPYNKLQGQRQWSYPIEEFGGIYIPHAAVFRGAESDGYPFFPEPQNLSFITVAAYCMPPICKGEDGQIYLDGEDYINNTKRKIETILQIALENKHDSIVLGAIGCGAFGNPPRHIAQLFREVINEKFQKSFRYIIFAIIGDSCSEDHESKSNIQPFADVFQVNILNINNLMTER